MAKIVPPRFNEGWGTWHAKIYGADDDLIISGANLNKAYFTNRRDRDIDLLLEISTFSYRLLPADSRQTANPHSYTSGDYTVVWSDPKSHSHDISEKAHRALSAFQASRRVGGEDAENSVLDVRSLLSNNPSSKPSVLLFPMIQNVNSVLLPTRV
ncbi:hypothetical protein D9757_004934 [Collybiopsis confluens]|uniref:CDP-diacylglycerol--glycerol-3-phosphate 3-phosphatidyltransferase n=1 Tax=Collybiopsis confluens TaxID=2823264 RepID=A0A8H5HT96_9AGAR|nr:hypothetical protein D9757_004934 [Collybiopsis confluens]